MAARANADVTSSVRTPSDAFFSASLLVGVMDGGSEAEWNGENKLDQLNSLSSRSGEWHSRESCARAAGKLLGIIESAEESADDRLTTDWTLCAGEVGLSFREEVNSSLEAASVRLSS